MRWFPTLEGGILLIALAFPSRRRSNFVASFLAPQEPSGSDVSVVEGAPGARIDAEASLTQHGASDGRFDLLHVCAA